MISHSDGVALLAKIARELKLDGPTYKRIEACCADLVEPAPAEEVKPEPAPKKKGTEKKKDDKPAN